MVHYQIRIEGVLTEQWSEWFEGLQINSSPEGETVILGALPDQAALHGVLTRIRDLGLVILEVQQVDAPAPD